MNVQFAESQSDVFKCFEAMNALRPHLTPNTFVDLVEKMRVEKYQLIYIEENNKVMAVCGFRYVTNLFESQHIYIDDLSTLPEARGKGYGGALFDFVVEKAKSEGLSAVHLDSGHQRHDAHRLYLNKKMKIVFHHFRLEL